MRIHDIANDIQSPTELFIKAVCTQSSYSRKIPFVLSYAPVASMNPFQRLLYCQAAEAGYAVIPAIKFDDLGRVNWEGKSVIHLHWLGAITRGASSNQEANIRVREFGQRMDNWKETGHKILWTMHNLLPHNSTFTDAEIELRRRIVHSADAIHILSEQSLVDSKPLFSIPEHKVFHVPHPSYAGWYPNISHSTSARLDLNIDFNAFVFLQFGSMQPYKGTLELIEAYRQLERLLPSRRFRLVIAGKPSDRAYFSEIRVLAEASRNITVMPSAMEEREVQTLFNAADIVVAPYTSTLNSGIALLAATFGKALVAPNAAGIRETFIEDDTLLYSGTGQDTLLAALLRAVNHKIAQTVFTKISAKHNPARVSGLFFDTITDILFK